MSKKRDFLQKFRQKSQKLYKKLKICDYKNKLLARRNKTEGKMTLTVDAARAAFNSSTTTVSVKQARQYVVSPDFAKTWI